MSGRREKGDGDRPPPPETPEEKAARFKSALANAVINLEERIEELRHLATLMRREFLK